MLYTPHSRKLCSPPGNSSVDPITLLVDPITPLVDLITPLVQMASDNQVLYISPTLTLLFCGQTPVIAAPILPR
jgi:hypothetical protein